MSLLATRQLRRATCRQRLVGAEKAGFLTVKTTVCHHIKQWSPEHVPSWCSTTMVHQSAHVETRAVAKAHPLPQQHFQIPRKPVPASSAYLLPQQYLQIPRKPVPALSSANPEGQSSNNVEGATSVSSGQSTSNPADSKCPPGWRPLSLHRRALLAFLGFFVASLAALESIYQLSNDRQGLVAAAQDKYYLWTYGPTASKLYFGQLYKLH